MEARSAVTLLAVARLAALLYRLRILFMVVAAAAGAWFVVNVLASAGSTRSLLALSVLLWAGLALGMGFSLAKLPPRADPADAWVERLRKRALQLLYWLATLAFLGLAAFSLFLSLRALRLALE